MGMRYGLLGVWTGKNVRQFKKEEWQTRAFPIIQGYKDIVIDTNLLLEDQAGGCIL